MISTKALLTASGALWLASAAAAQDTPPPPPEPMQSPTLESVTGDIVVTARKREESLQETPISISAYTGEGLTYRGVQTTQGLANITPNLTLQNNPAFGGSANSAAIYIRGIGQQDFVPTVEPGVGVYVDGVYIARSVGAILDLLDFERVEVLRGPQGTLFGRNTIGGAISITSRAPSPDFEGRAVATYGTDDLVTLKGTVNLPLASGAYLRASIGYFGQDGYVRRTSDGLDLGNSNRLAGRLALRLEPASNLTLDLAADGTHAREHGPAVTLLGIAFGRTVDPNTPPFVDINNIIANVMSGGPPVPCATAGSPLNIAVPSCFDNRYVLGPRRNGGTAPSFSDSDIWGVSFTADWKISDGVGLKSITAFRRLTSRFARDGDGSPLTIAQYFDDLHQKQFSQELQLSGTGFSNRLKWILGGYYFRETGNNINLLKFTISEFQSGGRFDNRSLAIFGQGIFDLTRTISLTAGARYTDDRKAFTPDQVIQVNRVAFLGPPFNSPIFDPGTRILPFVRASRSFNEFTPMVNLSWKPISDLLTYATYSRGFKSGGFTQRVFPPIIPGVTTPVTDPVAVIPSFGPERVNSWEIGFKYTTPSRLLRLNAAFFNSDYKDLQIQVFTSVAPVFKNAASATIRGFEAEAQVTPGDGWLIEANAGLTDAQYDQIDQATTFVSRSNALERISKWTLFAAVSRETKVGTSTLVPRISWAYRSRFFNNTFNTPQIVQPGYSLVDASLTWRLPGNRFMIRAGVENLFDKRYLISGVYGDAFQTYEGVYARGRQWSLTLQADF